MRAVVGVVALVGLTVCVGAPVRAAIDEPGPRDFREFVPSRDGFAFVNSFEGSPLPTGMEGVAGGMAPSRFGLCGGMSFAAADWFIARRSPPAEMNPPKRGTPLYEYLWGRQRDSLGRGFQFAGSFGRWMSTRSWGVGGLRSMTLAQAGPIVEQLRAGRPVVLGLVLVSRVERPRGPLWENHQVLAYRVEETRATGSGDGASEMRLAIYDPNYPKRDDVRIRMVLSVAGVSRVGVVPVPWMGVECVREVGGRRTRVLGVFAMEYVAKVPSVRTAE